MPVSPPEMRQAGCKRQSNNGFQGDSECSVLPVTPYFCSQTGTDQWVQFAQIASGESIWWNHTEPIWTKPTTSSQGYFCQSILQPFSNLTKSNQQIKSSNTEAANKNRVILLKAELLHQHSRRHAEQQHGNLHLHIYILKATASTSTSGHFFFSFFFS